nr:reverse transcriptase domain-containing protein [Tanacetum cinerariifolium]
MKISAFMSNSKCPELARRFADQVPQTVTEMMKRVDEFFKSEEAYKSTELPKGEHPKRGQGTPYRGARPPRVTQGGGPPKINGYNTYNRKDHYQPYVPSRQLGRRYDNRRFESLRQEKENMDRYCDYHGEKGHYTNDCYQLKRQLEAALESGKLNHLVKDVRQRGKNQRRQAGNNITNGKGAAVQVMFEHCLRKLPMAVQARLTQTHTELVGFSAEQLLLMGKIKLEVMFESKGLCRRTMKKFTVVQASSPYNIILGRKGMSELRAISFTMHAMMKFPTPRGIVTLVPQTAAICECQQLEEKHILPEEQPKERTTKRDENAVEEEVMVNPVLPDQKIQMSEEDEEKTAFYSDHGTYCYVKMPFGLKNAGETYQRLVDSAFQAPSSILNKPDVSGKLAKYAVELGAYNITYIPRNAVKGQILTDFLNEVSMGHHAKVCSLTDEEGLEEWILFTDEASSLKEARAGLVLIDPTGTEYTYAIRLNFVSTNNEVEYEALLAGL